MRRHILDLLMLIALVLQGVVTAGAGVPADHGQEQHCAGHEASQQDCACCPDGVTMSMSCTAQCSVSQAPMVMLEPIRLASFATNIAFVQSAFADQSYAPLDPPPIA